MIDPARIIAAVLRIYDLIVFKAEIKCVIWILRVVRVPPLRFLPRNTFARVFDDALAFSKAAHGVDALPVDAGWTHFEPSRSSFRRGR